MAVQRHKYHWATEATLNLTSLTPEGTVGRQFRVDYADVLTADVTNLILQTSPYMVIDLNSPGQTKRFYRALPGL